MAASRTNSATIPNGATTSNSCDTGSFDSNQGFVGFAAPAAMTGTSISFNVSMDDNNDYQPLFTEANALLTITITPGKSYGFSQDFRSRIIPWRYIQIVSNQTEGAARTFALIYK